MLLAPSLPVLAFTVDEARLRPVLALSVFGLDLWALASLLGAPLPRSRKLAWTAAIVFIPILGFLLWLRRGPRSTAAVTRS